MSRRKGSISPSHTRGMAKRRARRRVRVSLPRSGFTTATENGPDLGAFHGSGLPPGDGTGSGIHRSLSAIRVCVFHASGNVSRNAFFLILVCEVLEFQARYANGNVSRLSSFGLTVSTALRTGRFAVSILAGMPSAFILSIIIHGVCRLWHLDWSGIAPVMLGGNLSRAFCFAASRYERKKTRASFATFSITTTHS